MQRVNCHFHGVTIRRDVYIINHAKGRYEAYYLPFLVSSVDMSGRLPGHSSFTVQRISTALLYQGRKLYTLLFYS